MTSVAVVGLGLLGRERLLALVALRQQGLVEIVAAFDPGSQNAEQLTADHGVPLVSTLDDVLGRAPDVVFVATPHDVAVELLRTLLPTGVRVFVEKPYGRSAEEAQSLDAPSGQVAVGMNYRFFRGIERLISDVREGRFGEPISLRMHMGHGGAPGMERGWKFDPVKAGGGALIDPGIHLLNLAQLMAGPGLRVTAGTSWGGFWKTGIEEECHLLLESELVPVVNLSVSVVRWRSEFRIEFHGTDGYGIVEGRGRSYGPQTYRRGDRWGWQNAPSQQASEELVVHDDGDDVFVRETTAALFPTPELPTVCDREEALSTMKLLDRCRDVLGLEVPQFNKETMS